MSFARPSRPLRRARTSTGTECDQLVIGHRFVLSVPKFVQNESPDRKRWLLSTVNCRIISSRPDSVSLRSATGAPVPRTYSSLTSAHAVIAINFTAKGRLVSRSIWNRWSILHAILEVNENPMAKGVGCPKARSSGFFPESAGWNAALNWKASKRSPLLKSINTVEPYLNIECPAYQIWVTSRNSKGFRNLISCSRGFRVSPIVRLADATGSNEGASRFAIFSDLSSGRCLR